MRKFKVRPATWRGVTALLIASLICGLLGRAPARVAAADCIVTSVADGGAGTLRAALANSDGYTGCNTIGFVAGLGDITVSQRLLIDRSVMIEGPGSGSQVVQYGDWYAATGSVFQITGGPTTLRGLTIQGGKALGVWGGGVHILNTATPLDVMLDRVTVRDNVSTTGGGGIYISNGTLLLRNSIVSGNTADPFTTDPGYGGGGLFIGNEFGPVAATIDGGTQVLGNTANKNNDGGGILARRKDGLAVAPPQLTIADSTIGSVAQPNTVGTQAGGGGLRTDGMATLTNVAVVGNKAAAGGGILNGGGTLTLEAVTLTGNQAASAGGGLHNYGGTANVNNSTIGGNMANGTGWGGGILNLGTLTLTNSTLRDNTAVAWGGALYNDRNTAVAILTNVTISGNTAFGRGGGLLNYLGSVTLNSNTVVANTAPVGAGIANYTLNNLPGTTTALRQSIVAGNGQEDCATTDMALAPFASLGHNLVGDDADCPLTSTDVALSGALDTALNPALTDNGGPTATHALVAGSPAVDLAPVPCTAPTDQRGVIRPQGTACDSGAFELAAASPSRSASPSATPKPSSSPGASPTASPSASPITSPSPVPVTYALTVTAGPGGSASGGGVYPAGATATAAAVPAPGQLFLGWTFDGGGAGHLPGAPDGWGAAVSVTMAADHALVAAFAPRPAFGDAGTFGTDGPAIDGLAARGVIKGYQPEDCAARGLTHPCYGAADPLARAQMAALIVRAFGWGGDTPPATTPFSDLGVVDPELQRAIAILHARGVVQGYGDGTFGPTDAVLQIQAIAFVTRAMVAAGYWMPATGDDPAVFPEVSAASGHRLDLVTYVQHTGPPPGLPTGAPWPAWDQPALRGWMASALWLALDAHFGRDEPGKGGYIP